MANIVAIRQVPSRIRYYLLDWKDKNMKQYIRDFGEIRLHDLRMDQIHQLFLYASSADIKLIQ